ncbi:unnamed protein product [Dibothriocephalus latus]|uniref:Uncharacterized protein n=1 Tax=Dibothriocephalus latus TaxID=60516 RepID=A0A3P7QX46_DIBLA|nr:unnamed protein product [Dibothriocephalus latus]
MNSCLEKVLRKKPIRCPLCQEPFALGDPKPLYHQCLEDVVRALPDKSAFCALCERLFENRYKDLQSSDLASGPVCAECAAKQATSEKTEEKQ